MFLPRKSPWGSSALFIFSLGILAGLHLLFADVTSRTGSISFDVNQDGQKEATLTTDGLKIGTGNPSANLHVSGNAIITGTLTIGTTTTTSNNLYISGSLGMSVLSVTSGSNKANDSSVVLADTSAGNVYLGLPDPRESTGRMITVKRISTSNNLTIGGGGGNIENFESLLEIPSGNQNASYVFVSNGTQWYILSSLFANATEGSNTLSTNLILHWPLDETSGNVISETSNSTNTYTGNLYNEHYFSGNSVSGAVYNALKFDDLADSAEHRNGGNVLVDQYSWSLWVKTSIDPSVAPSAAPEDPPQGALGYSFVSDNTLWRNVVFHRKADDSVVGANISNFNTGSWNHIVATWNGSTLTAYHNGTLTDNVAVADLSTQAGNIILQHPGDDGAITSSVDDLQIFDRALDSEEVQTLYHSGSIE